MENIEINELQSLVTTLEKQQKVKTDIVLPANHIIYKDGMLNISGDQYIMSELANEQCAQKLGIPIGYYRTMKNGAPELLEQNINGWLNRKTSTKYLLRTFNYPQEDTDNICRAMLSNRYNILDNYDVLLTALKAIKDMGVNVEIREAKVTEQRMYLYIVCPEIEIQAEELLKGYLDNQDTKGRGNGIISGLCISNSEVGMGTFEVSPRAQILRCLNGMIDRKSAVKRVHLGAKMDTSVINWSEGTKSKNYELIMEMTKDAVKTFLSKDYLGNMVNRLQAAKGMEVQHPTGLIEHLAKDMGIVSEEQKASILNYFIKDGDHTGLGVVHAITRSAQNQDADTRYDMESMAFQVLPKLKGYDKPVLSKN